MKWPKQNATGREVARRQVRVGRLAAQGWPATHIAEKLDIPRKLVIADLQAMGAIDPRPRT